MKKNHQDHRSISYQSHLNRNSLQKQLCCLIIFLGDRGFTQCVYMLAKS